MRSRFANRIIALLLLSWLPTVLAWAQAPVNYADWRLEWAEEFNTPLDTTDLALRWRFYFPWGRVPNSSIESDYYTGKALHTATGTLSLTNRRLLKPLQYQGRELRYSAEMLISRHPNDSLRPFNCNPAEGFSYGLFEVRARQPKRNTSGPAFWLYGGAPDEIDVFEAVPDAFSNNFHLAPGGYWRPSRTHELSCSCLFYNTDPAGDLHAQFHTYGVSWMPDGVIFYYDGIPIRHETQLIPAGCAMNIILSNAAFSWATHASDTLAIDYIRVYRPRHLRPVAPVWRQGAAFPLTEQAWLPAETPPGRPDQGTHQTWQLAAAPRKPRRLSLQLNDNYNPPCELSLPLPVGGHWAPALAQTAGTPELRVEVPGTDSVCWAVHDLDGREIVRGAAPGGGTWLPRWPALAPGTYVLHLQQGQAALVHRLTILGRPANSQPDAIWQQPAALPTE